MKCIFSVDVEDWFHILDLPSTPALEAWDSLPSRVEGCFQKLLDIFSEANVSTTCFFLGWVAQKMPHLVKEAERRGHEVASHGYAHRLAYEMTPEEFRADAARSKAILEDIVGRSISGYRAAGFSVTQNTPWFFEKLIEAGYRYDSSVFPARRSHGGIPGGGYAPYPVSGKSGQLIEFPMTVANLLGRRMCFFGGGYLRLFPLPAIDRMARKVLRENRPVVFYVHPREIDPSHPRLPMTAVRRLKCYVNLGTTQRKIQGLLARFEVTSFERYLSEMGGKHAESPGEHVAAERPPGSRREANWEPGSLPVRHA